MRTFRTRLMFCGSFTLRYLKANGVGAASIRDKTSSPVRGQAPNLVRGQASNSVRGEVSNHIYTRTRPIWHTGPALACLCLLLTTGCSQTAQPDQAKALAGAGQLDAIQTRHELVIATRNAPTIWYINRDGKAAGPEHDLAAALANHLGVKPRFVVMDSVEAMLNAVRDGQVDMAAGSITRTSARAKHFTFGPDYAKVWQDVVCNSDNKPRNAADLAQIDKLVVAADTSYTQRLQALTQTHPDLHWTAAADIGTEALLAQVAAGDIGCTVADSNIVKINRRYHPSLLVMFKLSQTQHLAWPMPRGSTALAKAATDWLASYKHSGKLAALNNKYYGFLGQWDFVDKRALTRRVKNVYPKYQPLFAKAARDYDFNQWLLAAQAYQESHWNPHATSPTGVRGMMMLTQNTAAAMGVDNRLDPAQSVMGGAAYLRKMEQKLPDNIGVPDRYYFALAAYNIGYYHLRDAMHLAQRHGKNPHSWAAVKETLPLLMRKKYYRTVNYGYARGTEAVRYVRRIRDYGDIIRHLTRNDSPDIIASTDTP